MVVLIQAGYIDPEFTRTHEYHRHCEVYSMGITILQVHPLPLPDPLHDPLHSHTLYLSLSHAVLSPVLVVMRSMELKTPRSLMLILCLSLTLPTHPVSEE